MEIYEQVLIELRKIIRAIDLHSKQIQKLSGITGPQLLVLHAINKTNELTTGEVAKDVGLSQATVTSILDRLEVKELVQRVRSTSDKRKVMVSLSLKGKMLINKAPPLLQDKLVESIQNIPPAEQELMLQYLEKLSSMMGANDIDASPLIVTTNEKV